MKTKKLKVADTTELFMMSLPAIIWFIIFSYLPMIGLVLAFKDFKYSEGIFRSKWVGLRNFEFFFESNDAGRIFFNTLGYNLSFLVFNLVLAITLALILNTVSKKIVKIGQTSLMLPYFISMVIVGYIGMALFDYESGLLNSIMKLFGKEKVAWYETTKPWPFIFIIVNAWKTIGTTTLIFYGSLLGIGEEIYEAAELDGCVGLNRIFKITLPLLKPAIITMIILNIGNSMRADFGLFYYLPSNSSLLYPVTDVIDTYVYRALRINGDVSASAAIGFFQSVIGFIMVVSANAIVKKLEPGSEMF